MATEESGRARLAQRSYEVFNELVSTNEQYQEMLESVKLAKNSITKTTLQYRQLKRFDICSVRGVEKLITRVSSGCQKKLKSAKKGLVVKPMVFSEMNSRCQVDLIDMQSHPDREYKFIMVYQDHLTKFVQIRPLTSKRAEEVAKSLVDIFCIFGAPSILQSDNGWEFANHVIEELCTIWSGLKIVHGKPRHSQSQGLRFVQLMKNRAYHDGIKQAPYTAMFGHDIKVGLSTSAFPKEAIENLRTEEELEKVVREFGLGKQPQQEININQSMDSEPEPDNLQEDITEHMENGNNNYRENPSNTETSENQSKYRESKNSEEGVILETLMTVIEKTDDDLYKLANKRGTIEEMFSRNQFSVCSEKLIEMENVSPEKKI
ncbi:KRAB-A domain-containing protein 2-like [Anthonomus grandis grandis]|uniref:KRAB-A domain-containing protein 2-like n=1 Tax=Anthonomus grandis grandis TaxID=2921223 RepID=UPI0021664551|nr:KRAB-A domain-containing protein 2-like [Anthonomus grandis grandis]